MSPVRRLSPLRTAAATLAVPLMPLLSVERSPLALPVLPESPEFPLAATGLAVAVELAGPVLPVLVAVDCAHAVPESPDWASGDSSIHGEPPSPPLARPWAMESPPVTLPPLTTLLRPATVRRTRASPARSERTVRWSPPRPPFPPVAFTRAALAAWPVSPDTELASEAAPLLAPENAVLAAAAFPVSPVLPESPLRTAEAPIFELLAGWVLSVAAVSLVAPVFPESPESPDRATGSAIAVEEAAPVSPVLVDDDWARDRPESPEMAAGLWVTLTSPPSPPLTEPLAMESPPVTLPNVTRLLRPRTVWRARASPARPERTVARSPPFPPSPPMSVLFTALAALPVSPDSESALESAPELATLFAVPSARALPVSPVRPESPDTTAVPLMLALPATAVFTVPRVALAAPVLPESPELPDTAVGFAIAVELAGPVSPVLVDDDCAHETPESPDCASGD